MLGRKQADLAESVGISPSYLNLIEHNRRRIGGKLVQRLAVELGVDVAQLTEGAEAALVNTLREAVADHDAGRLEADRLEEFVGRFPGLARLLSDTQRRVLDLERTVQALSDRMTHDPFLSSSLHEVLSTVTAIRATSAILVDTRDIDAEWRERFHRNIAEESMRLTESAEALVRYLDEGTSEELKAKTPQEEVDLWLSDQGYHIPDMERALAPDPTGLVDRVQSLSTKAARDLACRHLRRLKLDVDHMPLAEFADAAQETALEPAALAQRFGVDLAAVFRRLAGLPDDLLGGRVGLVSCDASGTLTFRKPVEGFALPRYSAACPIWPLYQSLSRPMAPIRQIVEVGGRAPQKFLTYAICQPAHPAGFSGPLVLQAHMLIVPISMTMGDSSAIATGGTEAEVLHVGTSCRVCTRSQCSARREPSILAEAD